MRNPTRNRRPTLDSPVPERLFRYLIELEIEKALRFRYTVALLCLAPDVASTAARTVARRIAEIAHGTLRQTDVTATLGPSTVGLLLVGAEPCTLSRILDRAGGAVAEPGNPRFACGRRLVSVSAGGSAYPATAPSAAGLLGQAQDLMRRARREGGDRLLVPPLPAGVRAS